MGNVVTSMYKYVYSYFKHAVINYNMAKIKYSSNLAEVNKAFRFGYNQYYTLYIYFHDIDQETLKLYISSIEKRNQDKYFKSVNGTTFYTFDSGFDLYAPEGLCCKEKSVSCLDLKVSCCMKMGSRYVGYYLYPRSSTGSNTPLRFANSVGIIDSGYRGNIKVYFDNISNQAFNIVKDNRYVQICPPNLEYPLYVVVVNKLEDLGNTIRGAGGFGSTD